MKSAAENKDDNSLICSQNINTIIPDSSAEHLEKFIQSINGPKKDSEYLKDVILQGFLKWSILSKIKFKIMEGCNFTTQKYQNRYETEFITLRTLGYGANCEVYEAKCVTDRKIYAVKKIMLPHNNKTTIKLLNILNECRILSKINHPNVVKYHNAWFEADFSHLYQFNPKVIRKLSSSSSLDSLMGLYEEDFDDEIDEDYNYENTIVINIFIQMEILQHLDVNNLSNQEKLMKAKEVSDGLSHIHSLNLIHRDIKPANILFNKDNVAKISDFGISLDRENSSYAMMGYSTGVYASPEHLDIDTISDKSDIYSLGLTFFQLFYNFRTKMEESIAIKQLKEDGIFPESSDDLKSINQLILSMIDKYPENRPSAKDVSKSLSNILQRII